MVARSGCPQCPSAIAVAVPHRFACAARRAASVTSRPAGIDDQLTPVGNWVSRLGVMYGVMPATGSGVVTGRPSRRRARTGRRRDGG